MWRVQESITRAAGATHGQELGAREMQVRWAREDQVHQPGQMQVNNVPPP